LAIRLDFLLFNECNRTAKLNQTDYAANTRDIRSPEDAYSHFGCSILFQPSEIEQLNSGSSLLHAF
jgi:hypothetical protein